MTDNNFELQEQQTCESYRFSFDADELNEIYKSQIKLMFYKPFLFTGLAMLSVVGFIYASVPDILTGILLGIILERAVYFFRSFSVYKKSWKSANEKICRSVYEYQVFEDYFIVYIYRGNEKVRESKCYFSDIEKIRYNDKYLFMEFGGQLFIVRKSELKENSFFYSFMYKNPTKTIQQNAPDKYKILSTILLVMSLLSALGAIALVGAVSSYNNLFNENMWLFFLFTPIPIASVIFGFVLKSKGYKYKKNMIIGIIMTVFLCVYGSFAFIF